jgi:ATP-dependent RNA helicase RhlE
LSFENFGLDALLMRAVVDAGYETATPIQAGAIPIALKGADLIGTAQTGTGKTAAFVLPILQHLLHKPSQKQSRVLIVCPTRELAEQIHETIGALAKYTKIRSATIYGGVGMTQQEDALRNGVEILVACPGRLLDHVDQGNTRFGQIDHLVLDEADRMFDMGFLPQVRKIVDLLPKQRQTLLFSATMPKEVEALAQAVLRNPQRVNIGVQKPATTISHALYPVPPHLKTKLLIDLLAHTNAYAMLVFTRTKHRADKLARVIGKAGFEAAALHGDRSQNQRQRALDGFKRGKVQVLVATDIASRGLDIDTVSHVINFDVPGTPEDYIHRIGRTGRAERTGDAFTLVTPEDRDLVRDIERVIGTPIERRELDGFDYRASAPEMQIKGGENSPGRSAERAAETMAERHSELNNEARPQRERSQPQRERSQPQQRRPDAAHAERPQRQDSSRGPREQRNGNGGGHGTESRRPSQRPLQRRSEHTPAQSTGKGNGPASGITQKYPWMSADAPRPQRSGNGGNVRPSRGPGGERSGGEGRPSSNSRPGPDRGRNRRRGGR